MKGLELGRAFYRHCRPLLMATVPDIMARAAVGLVGEGSECLGCDDAISRDHDFGPAFCIWLPRAELECVGLRLKEAMGRLPQSFAGYPSRLVPERRNGRVGPLAIEDFFYFFTGLEQPTPDWQDWLRIPEHHLASCTNGEVFEDNLGEFGRWREVFLAYYPRDVRLKKMAARCMVMAQAGQYNLPRMLQRGDGVAAMLAVARFAEAALSLVFLCNHRYMPFYKWAGHIAATLPVLGQPLGTLLTQLAAQPLRGPQDLAITQAVESFCEATAAHLRVEYGSSRQDAWLWEHGIQLLLQIENAALRDMDAMQA